MEYSSSKQRKDLIISGNYYVHMSEWLYPSNRRSLICNLLGLVSCNLDGFCDLALLELSSDP